MEDNNLIHRPGNIFNMDETGLQFNNKPGNVIAVKESKCLSNISSTEKGETISRNKTSSRISRGELQCGGKGEGMEEEGKVGSAEEHRNLRRGGNCRTSAHPSFSVSLFFCKAMRSLHDAGRVDTISRRDPACMTNALLHDLDFARALNCPVTRTSTRLSEGVAEGGGRGQGISKVRAAS
ncbi:hypothetical protein E2C01_035510 [Portunus trituberculatus]|uniref:Uncharacterized protein n=1 Tax=Portunus trituberculatus TaxID=210409 RepID=A0A5B7F619_PORTR|nr:hypothetical protein [Portunus trituberculatus]